MRNRKYKFQVEKTGKNGWTPFKTGLLLGTVLLCVILVIVVVSSRNGNENNQEVVTYHEIEGLKLPKVEIVWNNQKINQMIAYKEQMDTALTGNSIAPVGLDRTLDILISEQDAQITGISYRVRDMETDKLIEDGKIKDWEEGEGTISAQIAFSSLIEEHNQYQMELILKTKNQGELYYHARIYCGEQETTARLLQFAEEFSAATLDKSAAESVLVPYILTGESRNNEDLSHVDLYHKFSALTWGDLSPRLEGETQTVIHELSANQMSLTFTYTIASEDEEGEVSYFSVSEFFCVRLRNGNIYILDYSRDMEEMFQGKQSDIQSASIHLGVGSEEEELVSSANGNYLSFVRNNQVWLLDVKEGQLQRIFAWEEGSQEEFQVRPVQVSDEGNVDFMVYGYIPQGEYEGNCQIQGYRYDLEKGGLNQTFYIPADMNLALLESIFGDVAHINEGNMCYLLLDHTLYEINLTTGAVVTVSETLQKGFYSVNDQGNMIAWEEGENLQMPSSIQVLNMDTGEMDTISAQEDGYVALAGFVGTDMVYGSGAKTIAGIYEDGSAVYPYEHVSVINQEGEVLRTYDSGEEIILSVAAYDNYISLQVGKLEGEVYKSLREEKLLSSQEAASGTSGSITWKKSEQHLTEQVLVFNNTAANSITVKTQLPLMADESSFLLKLEQPKLPENSYYSFGRGKLVAVSQTMSQAIAAIYDCFGTVTGPDRSIYWNRDARALYTNISINERKAEREDATLAACMQMFLEKEGLYDSDLEEQLTKKTPEEILQDAFGERMIDLQGCQVSWLLYYINGGSPVLAITGDNTAVLLVGYDTNHVVVYDGIQDRYTMTMEEAETYFAQRGSRFISYLP